MSKVRPQPTPQVPGWSDALLQDVLDAVPDAIIGVDTDGLIRIANAHVTDIFGYEPDELLAQPVELLLPDRLREAHRSQRADFTREEGHRSMGSGLSLRGRRKNATEFPADISLGSVHTKAGRLMLAAIRDIAERIEEEVRARSLQELLRLKTELVHVLSHELFTPITAIQGIAGTLLNVDVSSIDRGQLSGLFDGVARASERLRRLVRHIDVAAALDLGVAPVSLSPVAIGDVVRSALEDAELRPFKGQVHLSAPRAIFERKVSVDEALVTLAIVVVLENAFEFAPGAPVDISLALANGGIEVRISDLGPGIPERMREQAGNLFTQIDSSDTRPHEGVGVGLALAKKIVELHGGSLVISNREPQGTTVVLAFPLARAG
jgi:protein-histidine pros-kinase